MYYYLVWVRSNRYHGSEPLTYASERKLAVGSVVQVELQKDLVLGFISGAASQPRFKTKPITRVYDLPPLPAELLKLAHWIQAYYPSALGVVSGLLLPVSLSEKQLASTTVVDYSQPLTTDLPHLTTEQTTALAAMKRRDSYLLHGSTGSGKTRLYIELALQAVAAGRSAIILTPEISLTSQLAGSFQAVFGNRVVVLHSRQTPGERQAAWLACLRSSQSLEPLIVVGPRSALFSPLPTVGLIVLDEAHESAYKQDQAPHYQTGRVAAYLAGLARATLVLGSATPAVNDYFLAEQKHKPIIRLQELAKAITSESDQPPVQYEIIDKKDHDLFSRSAHLSLALIKAVETALARGEQSMLYLNRRGTARLIICQNCGWQADCPHCDVPLTYHGDSHQLRCHSCDHRGPAPSSCPSCGHADIIYKTAGTKAIVEEVQRLFPSARVARFDTDNLKAERFEQQYEAIHRGEVDILVGTQLLAKGLDLPKLSTLGILLADTSLYLPDYTAQERTFQLISQVLGRIGRGHVAGRAIIQTYHPEHPILAAAIAGDYAGFYATELAERKLFFFPPYCYILKLTVRRASIRAAEQAADKLKSELQHSGRKIRVEGPAPSFYERFQNKYQWQLIVKAVDRAELVAIIADLPANWSYDIDPVDLL